MQEIQSTYCMCWNSLHIHTRIKVAGVIDRRRGAAHQIRKAPHCALCNTSHTRPLAWLVAAVIKFTQKHITAPHTCCDDDDDDVATWRTKLGRVRAKSYPTRTCSFQPSERTCSPTLFKYWDTQAYPSRPSSFFLLSVCRNITPVGRHHSPRTNPRTQVNIRSL